MSLPIAAFLVLGILAAAGAQDETPQSTGYIESLKVNLVEVDVVVTDGKGDPVAGLTIGDFQVIEDGKKMKVTHFRAGHEDQPGTAAEEAPEALGAATSSPRGGYVVLLVDNYSIHPADRKRVIAGLREYLMRESVDDTWFALASYDGHVRMHQTFTRDKARLLEAVSRLEEVSPLGTLLMAERKATFRSELETLQSIRNLIGDDARGEEVPRLFATFSQQINGYAEELRQQNRTAFYAMGHLVNALSPLPGRKALVYISDGMPMRPGEELHEATREAYRDLEASAPDLASTTEGRQADIDRRSGALDVLSQSGSGGSRQSGRSNRAARQRPDGLLELTAMANAYQVSFYTLKPLTDYGGVQAQFSGDVARLFTPRLQGVREENLGATLRVMAADTGGLSHLGSDIETLLDRARSEFTNNYSLGYTPSHDGDGKYHEIKVKVRGKKLRVRHRSGYVDKSIEARLADRTTAALLLALDDNPHGILLATAEPQPGPKDSQWIVPVQIEIPLAALTLVDQGEALVCQALLFVAARGTDGRTAPVQAMDLRVEVPKSVPDPRSQSYTAQFNLALRSGEQRVAIGLLDPAAELISLVSHEVRVGVDD